MTASVNSLRNKVCVGLAISLLTGCSIAAPDATATDRFATSDMSVAYPAGEGWRIKQSTDTSVAFYRGSPEDSYVARVALFRMGPASTPQEYEALIRDGAAKDVDPDMPDRYEMLELSITYTTERTYPCVRYHGVSIDHGAKGVQGPLFLEVDGLHCRHPADPTVGAAILYSHRGLQRHPGQQAEAEEFVRTAELTTHP